MFVFYGYNKNPKLKALSIDERTLGHIVLEVSSELLNLSSKIKFKPIEKIYYSDLLTEYGDWERSAADRQEEVGVGLSKVLGFQTLSAVGLILPFSNIPRYVIHQLVSILIPSQVSLSDSFYLFCSINSLLSGLNIPL